MFLTAEAVMLELESIKEKLLDFVDPDTEEGAFMVDTLAYFTYDLRDFFRTKNLLEEEV